MLKQNSEKEIISTDRNEIQIESKKYSDYPVNGFYGKFGGAYAPEILQPALGELLKAFEELKSDENFLSELHYLNRHLGGRPTPLYKLNRLTKKFGNAPIILKREDLVHGGAHKFNNVIGQALVAKFLGKPRIIAETGAGQHGVATSIVGAALGLETEIFMGEVDIQRQMPNVQRMKLLGAKVTAVKSGSRTLKDAVNEAMRNWVATVEDTHYLIGSVVGPHPFPLMVRHFQSVIGKELKSEFFETYGRLPSHVVACVGGGSNAAGTFYPLIDDDVELIGVEAGGRGTDLGENSATLNFGSPAIIHGAKSYSIQDNDGQIIETHSISAGLDYPGVGPEHSFWKESGRVRYTSITDTEALQAFNLLCKYEGIIPALESSHALAYALKLSKELDSTEEIVVTLSGRGDKDLNSVLNLQEKE